MQELGVWLSILLFIDVALPDGGRAPSHGEDARQAPTPCHPVPLTRVTDRLHNCFDEMQSTVPRLSFLPIL